MRVRGGATEATWNFLKRHGIVPGRDITGLGKSEEDCSGNHEEAEPKAMLPLSRRDAVRRIVNQVTVLLLLLSLTESLTELTGLSGTGIPGLIPPVYQKAHPTEDNPAILGI